MPLPSPLRVKGESCQLTAPGLLYPEEQTSKVVSRGSAQGQNLNMCYSAIAIDLATVLASSSTKPETFVN